MSSCVMCTFVFWVSVVNVQDDPRTRRHRPIHLHGPHIWASVGGHSLACDSHRGRRRSAEPAPRSCASHDTVLLLKDRMSASCRQVRPFLQQPAASQFPGLAHMGFVRTTPRHLVSSGLYSTSILAPLHLQREDEALRDFTGRSWEVALGASFASFRVMIVHASEVSPPRR